MTDTALMLCVVCWENMKTQREQCRALHAWKDVKLVLHQVHYLRKHGTQVSTDVHRLACPLQHADRYTYCDPFQSIT